MHIHGNKITPQLATKKAKIALAAIAILSWTQAHSANPGCHSDRRSTLHSAGVAIGAGSYMPCVLDTGMTSGESGLAITRNGTLLRSVATQPNGIASSSDNGATWQRRALPSGAKIGIADGIVDAQTDRYFYTGAFNAPIFGSDDAALTWQKGTLPFLSSGQDWPRLFIGRPAKSTPKGYANNVYYCNWTLPLGIYTDTRCFKSVDGGRTFKGTGSSPYLAKTCKSAAAHGRGVVDPRNGTIYIPAGFCGTMEVAVSHDEGDTWEHRVVQTLTRTGKQTIADSKASEANLRQKAEGRANLVTPELSSGQVSDALAIDNQGRLYMTWIDDGYMPVMATSNDGGLSWSRPVKISPPEVVQATLPAIAVSPDGRVGISYYATQDRWNWTGYLTVTSNGISTNPSFESTAVTRSDQPLMNEPCCWVSGPQEYTAARWAPDGSLWAAFAAYTPSGDAKGMVGRLVKPAH